jgi:hypothetical protein
VYDGQAMSHPRSAAAPRLQPLESHAVNGRTSKWPSLKELKRI